MSEAEAEAALVDNVSLYRNKSERRDSDSDWGKYSSGGRGWKLKSRIER